MIAVTAHSLAKVWKTIVEGTVLVVALSLLLSAGVYAGQATLAWDANTDPAVAGYMIHYGQSSGSYTNSVDAGKTSTFAVKGLQDGATYYYVVTAYDASRAESAYSNQASAVVPVSGPVASFNANVTAGPSPFAVSFTSTSAGSITSYAWNLGDGSSATTQNPTHSYSAAGVYSVSLTVSGSGGSNTQTKTGYITVSAGAPPPPKPVAGFTANITSGVAPLAINFTSTSSGSVTAYSWNFGDGTSSTAQNPLHNYGTPGTYTVSLTVTGPGGSNTQTKTGYVTVAQSPPVAAFAASTTNEAAPLTVTFTSSSSGTITAYAWDFGDGTTSTAQNPAHSYAAEGSYSVSLTVAGPGGSNTQTKTNFITVAAQTQPPTPTPVASFTADKTSGSTPLAVNFNNTSTGSITSYLWNFGDGLTSGLQNPTHTYSSTGTYTVSLKVTGPGGTKTLTKSNYITTSAPAPAPAPIPAAPRASFTASSTSGLAPLGISFTSASTGKITSYLWNFGDGGTSTSQTPTYTYKTVGTYSVSLTVAGPGGANMQTKAGYITVASTTVPPPPAPIPSTAPQASFSADTTSGTAPMDVVFTSTSTGNISSYSWDFGDGTTSVQQNPAHTYSVAGTFSVTLTVTGPAGSDSQSNANFITASSPIATSAAGASSSGGSSSGLGGGCTVGRIGGTGVGLDPVFPLMLLAAAYCMAGRRKSASPKTGLHFRNIYPIQRGYPMNTMRKSDYKYNLPHEHRQPT